MLDASRFMPALLQQGGGDAIKNMVVLILPLFLIWYFFLIRPQNKERKLQAEIRNNLKKGDRVLTQSGVVAKVQSVSDTEVVLNLDGTAKMRVLKDTIVRRLEEGRGSGNGKGGRTSKEEAAAAS